MEPEAPSTVTRSPLDSIRDRVSDIRTKLEVQLEASRDYAKAAAAAEAALGNALLSGGDTSRLEAALAKAEASRAAADRNAAILENALRKEEERLSAASRSDEAGRLHHALDADREEVPVLRERTAKALLDVSEAFTRGFVLQEGNKSRARQIEALEGPDAAGDTVRTDPISDASLFRELEAALLTAMAETGPCTVITVRIPVCRRTW